MQNQRAKKRRLSRLQPHATHASRAQRNGWPGGKRTGIRALEEHDSHSSAGQSLTKIIFAVIIGAAIITMVIYLVPGLLDTGFDRRCRVRHRAYPRLLRPLFGNSDDIKTDRSDPAAARQLQQQRLPDFLLPYMMQRAGQMLVQRAILQQRGRPPCPPGLRRGPRRELQNRPLRASTSSRTAQYIGDDQYINFVQTAFRHQPSPTSNTQVKADMELKRLQALITGGVTVSDNAVRDAYRKQGTKVKFDYAVISADDIKKTINPTDAELQDFFKQNAAALRHGHSRDAQDPVLRLRRLQPPRRQAPGHRCRGRRPTTTPSGAVQGQGAGQDPPHPDHRAKGADAKTDAAAKAKAEDS